MIDPRQAASAILVAAQESQDFESAMLSEDKLYVVLAVVLVIWFGIVLMLYRNDRKISALERRLSEGKPVSDSEPRGQ